MPRLVAVAALCVGAAFAVRWLVTRDLAPENLKTPILLAGAMGLYVVSNLVMDEAGLAAATIFGIALANLHIPGVAELARFKESLVVLIVSALFVVLTASLDRSLFTQLSWPIVLVTLAMIFVVRPAAIAIATFRSSLTWQERLLAGWIAPRGIVAAAVAGIARSKLSAAGYQGAELVMPAVFALIAATMILHGFSLAPLAKRLGLTLGDRPGLAVLGASPWSIDFAEAVKEAGTPVLVIDSYPGALDATREKRIPVLQAQILSEHGEEELAGRRIDYLFAATQNDVYNSLVCAKLSPEIGRGRVFQMAPAGGDIEAWIKLKREWRGQVIGLPPLDFATVRKLHKDKWRFLLREHEDEKTAVAARDEGEAASFSEDMKEGEYCLLVVRRNGDLAFASKETPSLAVATGDRIVTLAAPRKVESKTKDESVSQPAA